MVLGEFKNTTRLRARTLRQLRWVAIFGQLVTLAVAYFALGLVVNYPLILWIIALWGAINLAQSAVLVARPRMQSNLALVALSIDVAELGLILFLTGGLDNPFAILLLVPVVLGAIVLDTRGLGVLNLWTLAAFLLLYFYAQPLMLTLGVVQIPMVLRAGFLIALMVSSVFLSFYLRRTSLEAEHMTRALAASDLALQRELRVSSLGALVAAYAHELGTPLATIRLAASEALDADPPKDMRAELETIAAEARRSVDILADMGRSGKADLMIETVPFVTLVDEAVEPLRHHAVVAINIILEPPLTATYMPYVMRSAAIIHGLRNLIQNALSFAQSAIEIRIYEAAARLIVTIGDDGPGFPLDVLRQIGEPMRSSRSARRGESYEGMGLGIFISKTLLEANQATVHFSNRDVAKGGGGLVRVHWPKAAIIIDQETARAPLGANPEQIA